MKYIGALIFTLAGLWVGIHKALDERSKVYTLRAVCTMLEIMRSEIASRRTPMDELFLILGRCVSKTLRSFTESVAKKLGEMSDTSFAELWDTELHDKLSMLSDKSIAVLSELGGSLGRYDAQQQAAAINRALSTLSSELAASEERLKSEEKMYIALGGGLSLIISIVLV